LIRSELFLFLMFIDFTFDISLIRFECSLTDVQMASANVELPSALRRAVNQARVSLRKDANFTSLPLRNLRRICEFAANDADDHEDRIKMDRSVGAALSMLAELFVVDLCRRVRSDGAALEESALRGALGDWKQCDFLQDILRDSGGNDLDDSDSDSDSDVLDLGAYRLVNDASRDVGRLWLQLYCAESDRRTLLCKGRIDLFLVSADVASVSSSSPPSPPPRLRAEFRDCSATPRRMIFECESATIVGHDNVESDKVSLVRGTFEFNDASRIDLTGETRIARFWRDADTDAVDIDSFDTVPDRGTALLKFSFARAAVLDGLSGMLRTDAMFDCFPERVTQKKEM
jgi:hypothetical protein